MDKPIVKSKWTALRIAVLAIASTSTFSMAYMLQSGGGASRLEVDSRSITLAQVRRGEFQEYVPVTGSVTPHTSVYLDLAEGGIVEKIYVYGGVPVKKGELILSFSNAAAQKANIDSESRLLDTLNQLRTQKYNLTQQALLGKEQMLELEKQIADSERRYNRLQQLAQSVSKEEREAARDNLAYLKNRRQLLSERLRQEDVLRRQQELVIDDSIARTNRSALVLSRIIDSFDVRAPIDGNLSSMNAQIGQNFQRGQRIGQVDQLDSFKVRVNVDQYYISRVAIGQRGSFDFGEQPYQLVISKIYSEVTGGTFQADMEFVGNAPAGIKRGQTLEIRLGLSESKTTTLLTKGGFYRLTAGRWVYKIADDGMSARRVAVVPGRQNPLDFEVLEGLGIGDRIVASSYDGFGDAEVLKFSIPLQR